MPVGLQSFLQKVTTTSALRLSIAHCKENACARTVDEAAIGRKSCALCQIFFSPDMIYRPEDPCMGCPVQRRTGRQFCVDTPYDSCDTAWSKWHRYSKQLGPTSWYSLLAGAAFRRAARREVAFLESLLAHAL
jgi:hypothetical protein